MNKTTNTKKAAKKSFKSVSKKNRLKADFSEEIGSSRKCNYCKSYMKYSQICAVGNKPSSKFTCYRFVLRPGMEEAYKKFLLELRKDNKVKSSMKK